VASRCCSEKLLNGVAAFRRRLDRRPVAYLRKVHNLWALKRSAKRDET